MFCLQNRFKSCVISGMLRIDILADETMNIYNVSAISPSSQRTKLERKRFISKWQQRWDHSEKSQSSVWMLLQLEIVYYLHVSYRVLKLRESSLQTKFFFAIFFCESRSSFRQLRLLFNALLPLERIEIGGLQLPNFETFLLPKR